MSKKVKPTAKRSGKRTKKSPAQVRAERQIKPAHEESVREASPRINSPASAPGAYSKVQV